MAYEKEMTALNPSVAADEEQSNNGYGSIITDNDEKSNSFEANFENDYDYQNLDFDEEYVDTITMNELYNSVYGAAAHNKNCIFNATNTKNTVFNLDMAKEPEGFRAGLIRESAIPLWKNEADQTAFFSAHSPCLYRRFAPLSSPFQPQVSYLLRKTTG